MVDVELISTNIFMARALLWLAVDFTHILED